MGADWAGFGGGIGGFGGHLRGFWGNSIWAWGFGTWVLGWLAGNGIAGVAGLSRDESMVELVCR